MWFVLDDGTTFGEESRTSDDDAPKYEARRGLAGSSLSTFATNCPT